jgi:hypothetical protein
MLATMIEAGRQLLRHEFSDYTLALYDVLFEHPLPVENDGINVFTEARRALSRDDDDWTVEIFTIKDGIPCCHCKASLGLRNEPVGAGVASEASYHATAPDRDRPYPSTSEQAREFYKKWAAKGISWGTPTFHHSC